MGEITLPDTEKYAALPKNFKGEVKIMFEEKTGQSLNPFLEKRTVFTPTIGLIFNEIVDYHYNYWQDQVRNGEDNVLEPTTES